MNEFKDKMDKHKSKLTMAIRLGYPSQDILRILCDGNMSMWDENVRIHSDYAEQMQAMHGLLGKIRKIVEEMK